MFEERVVNELHVAQKPQVERVYAHAEEQASVNVLLLLRFLIRDLPLSQVPENEVAFHESVQLVNFDAIFEDEGLLIWTEDDREATTNPSSLAGLAECGPAEPPVPRLSSKS